MSVVFGNINIVDYCDNSTINSLDTSKGVSTDLQILFNSCMVVFTLGENTTVFVHFDLIELYKGITTKVLLFVFIHSNYGLVSSSIWHSPSFCNNTALIVVVEVVHKNLRLS